MKIHKFIIYLIATVWMVNGLFCKILNLVPRHEQIVSRILVDSYSQPLTIMIGILEILMGFWILSNYKPKLNAVVQIVVVGIMNILEFVFTKELLLWGQFNAVFALLFILLVYFTNFKLKKSYAIVS